MSDKKKRLSKFNFEDDGAAVALVSTSQGGPANGVTTLLTKSTKNPKIEKASEEEIQKAVEVNMKMSLLEFLTRYLGLWIDEAEVVAGMMGMTFDDLYEEDDISSFEEMVQSNLDKVQVNKSKETAKFEDTFKEFKEKYLSKTSSSVEDGGSVSKSTEDKTDKPEEVTNKMSDQNVELTADEQLEEKINKAAESIVAKRLEELEKSYEQKVEAATKEVELLKAREEAREKQEYLAKAEKFAKYMGEEADKEAIAKALSTIEKSEDAAAVQDVLKALMDTLEKEDEQAFEEIGKSATKDQPDSFEQKVEAVQKSLMSEEGITEHAAYVKAFDQVRAESK